MTNRLTIAIQKSGRLSKESMALLNACGVKFSINEAASLPTAPVILSIYSGCVTMTFPA